MVVVPLVFAVGLTAGNPQFPTFAAFGAVALLIFSDFGGPPVARARAYLLTTLGGLALIAIGTAVQPYTAPSVIFMAVVAFTVTFVEIVGGYFAGAGITLILSVVLSVSVNVNTGAYGARLGGWALAGGVATIAALVLWPRHERTAFARACARVARAVADRTDARTRGDDDRAAADEADAALDVLDDAAGTALYRPAGPSVHDRALAGVRDQLRRLRTGARDITPGPLPSPTETALANATVAALRTTADALDRAPDAPAADTFPAAVDALSEARARHRTALDAEVTACVGSGQASEVLDRVAADLPLRLLSFSTIVATADAGTALGAPLPTDPSDGAAVLGPAAAGGVPAGVLRTLRSHLRPGSVWFQNATRAGVALAVAVLVGRIGQLDHAFWVALGTLSVLRSNALGTGRTAADALLGTVIGFAIAGPFVAVVGDHTVALWIALPIAIFLAAYTPTVVHFVVGQASFTIVVVVLFNLIEPQGWRVGLVRVQDVAVGCLVSLAAVLILWPRGARGELRTSVEAQYADGAAYLAAAFRRVLGTGDAAEVEGARRDAFAASSRAGEAWQQYLTERGSKQEPPQLWSELVTNGRRLQSVAAFVLRLEALPPVPRILDGADAPAGRDAAARVRDDLARDCDDAVAACVRMAAEIGTGHTLHSIRPADGAGASRRRRLAEWVDRGAPGTAPGGRPGPPDGTAPGGPGEILTLLWAGELADQVVELIADLPDPARPVG